MKYFNVVSCRTFTDESGEEQKKYYRVGRIKETDYGVRYLTLFAQANDDFMIFDQDPEEEH